MAIAVRSARNAAEGTTQGEKSQKMEMEMEEKMHWTTTRTRTRTMETRRTSVARHWMEKEKETKYLWTSFWTIKLTIELNVTTTISQTAVNNGQQLISLSIEICRIETTSHFNGPILFCSTWSSSSYLIGEKKIFSFVNTFDFATDVYWWRRRRNSPSRASHLFRTNRIESIKVCRASFRHRRRGKGPTPPVCQRHSRISIRTTRSRWTEVATSRQWLQFPLELLFLSLVEWRRRKMTLKRVTYSIWSVWQAEMDDSLRSDHRHHRHLGRPSATKMIRTGAAPSWIVSPVNEEEEICKGEKGKIIFESIDGDDRWLVFLLWTKRSN